jgi:hypothetical protein
MMKKHFPNLLFWIWAILILLPSAARADRTLYSVSPNDNLLRVVNPVNGATVASASVPITLTGQSGFFVNGVARDPTTGKLWALIQLTAQTGRQLVTINPATGVATSIGNTLDRFAGLAFKSDGTLYGVTGDGAITPETLFTLSKTNGAANLVTPLGAGNSGEAIGFNPNDGRIYHASGNDTTGTGTPLEVFESINPSTRVITNIPLSGAYVAGTGNYLEVLALTHLSGSTLLLVDGDSVLSQPPRLATITTAGLLAYVGTMDHPAKGLAFAPKPPADFDRDIKNDVGIYSDGIWTIKRSSDGGTTTVAWGGSAWEPVQADYDGDGKVDIAVRNASNGLWSIVRSTDGGNTLIGWSAAANDIPVPADYDGDGKADFALYNNASAGWSIIRSSGGGLTYMPWGGPAWAPVEADYDGDGKVDIAVRNASNGLWSIVRSSDGGNTLFGWTAAANDTPVPADYDGDGKADFAVYNTASAGWSIIRSSDGGLTYMPWGGPGWEPVPADYDGDGKVDIAVYNASNGVWSIVRSSDGGNTLVVLGGAPQDVPLN